MSAVQFAEYNTLFQFKPQNRKYHISIIYVSRKGPNIALMPTTKQNILQIT